jgi:SAM-dependent methyltransferase
MIKPFGGGITESQKRLEAIATMADPETRRHISGLGLSPGWDCLEVGAGTGSVASWLADRVEESGHVLATDVDISLVERVKRKNLEVRKHDIGKDPLPEQAFDLVHARYVLEWVENREEALHKMIASLRPGGWLFIENTDWGALPPLPSTGAVDEVATVRRALVEYLSTTTAYDPDFGRQIVGRLKSAGLKAVGGVGRSVVIVGRSPSVELYRWDVTNVGQEIVAKGLVTQAALDKVLSMYDDPDFCMMSPLTISAWARKPT